MENIAFKTTLLRGAQGARGEAGESESVPTDGVLAYVGETTPQGYEEIQVSDVFTDIYADIDATQDMISDAYDATAAYAVGDYCIYNNVLYKCNTAISTPEAFTPAKWDATNVTSAIVVNSVKSITVRVELDTFTWYARTGCYTASSSLDELAPLTADRVIGFLVVSYTGIPIYVMLDGNYVTLVQWATSTPTGNYIELKIFYV